MNCPWCKYGEIGEHYFLENCEWAFCTVCNNPSDYMYPRWVIYQGKKDGKHLFEFCKCAKCSHCKVEACGCKSDCIDEGGTLILNLEKEYVELNKN